MPTPNPDEKTRSTSSTGEEAQNANPGGGAPNKDGVDFTKNYGPDAGADGAADAGAADGAAAPDPLVDELLGGLAGAPFDLAALKTGHEHWHLNPRQRDLMGRATKAVSARYVGRLDATANPLAVLIVGYLGFGIPRVVEELRLIREEIKKKNAG